MLLNGTLFFPNSGGDLRSDAHQSQIIGGDADVDHTQIMGEYNEIIGRIYPPIPSGFGTPGLSCSACMNQAFFSFGIGTNCNEKFGTK